MTVLIQAPSGALGQALYTLLCFTVPYACTILFQATHLARQTNVRRLTQASVLCDNELVAAPGDEEGGCGDRQVGVKQKSEVGCGVKEVLKN